MSSWWSETVRGGQWAACVALAMLIGSDGGPLLGRQPVPDAVWRSVGAALRPAALADRIAGGQATVMQFDKAAFDGLVNAAPDEAAMRSAAPLVFSLPLPDGTFSRFSIADSPIIAPELAAAYPEIRTFTGQGIDDPTATARFGWTAAGFHAIVLSSTGTTYIDPVTRDNRELYLVASKASRPQPDVPFICLLNGTGEEVAFRSAGTFPITNGDSLRTYRLALAATAEYTAAAPGGTKAAALARMVTTMNRVNGIYERELAVRMTLATGPVGGDPTALIYTNSLTDPYTDNDPDALLTQNQTNLTAVITAAGYDIGHVFSTGGGGVAQLNSPCGASKAMGVTGSSNPTGDAFDVDYVAHEMGHQFGGNHTFNATTSACGGGNRSASQAYEVGSGSTIQAYAGICGVENLQPNSNDYFHVESLNEMTAFITSGGGATCGTASVTGNTVPTAGTTAAFTIPASTPFTLTATGADANGDTLTYAWEEFDLGTASSDVASASTDNGSRPLFRSYSPSTSPSRTFPSLAYILNNANAPPATYACSIGTCLTGEVLPSTSRTMNFQVTVRDNRAAGGGIITAATAITVSAAAGPFQVTSPNTALSLTGGSAQTVTWSAASTASAPVSAANVRILLSTNGGTTFGTELLASTPNDGTQSIVLPNITTTTARIKVEAVGNVFFDVSNTNFSITAQQFQAALTGAQQVPSVASSATGAGTATLNLAETQMTVNMSFSGLTSVVTAAHIHGPAAAGSNANFLFDFSGVTPAATSGSIPAQTFAITPAQVADLKAGRYYFNIHTTNFGSGEIRGQITATSSVTAPGAPTGVTGTAGNAQVSVAFTAPASNGGAAITSYTVTSSPGGATASGSASPIVVTGLANGTAYTFIVTATNSVGTGTASGASSAVTPATVPGAPTGVTGTSGNAQVSVAFTAPASTGGAAITGYTVTASPGGATATGTASPLIVTGLTNGTAYTFTVTAANGVGTSAASSASGAVTPATVPGAPTSVSGVSDNSQVSVSFTAPSSNGGAAITAYTVTASPGGATASGSASPIVVTGLTNGTPYTFTVRATNSAGSGVASAASAAVTPVVPTITGAPSTLVFAATKNGAAGAIVSVTSPQSVSVTYVGGSAPQWTATANQPWVQITNGARTGNGTFTVGISDTANAIGGSTALSATITIAASSPNRSSTVALSLSVTQAGASLLPFGSFDTPVAGASVDGSIAVTGWALDDVEVTRVEIWRDRVAGETTPVYGGSGPGNGKIYIADPVFVTGARPDVEAGYAALPLANRAGWGYLLLTQGLWNQGNGPFTLYAFAYDREGRSAVLGSKAITVSNATAVRPFGSIDVPAYGQTMTTSFYNFGWALTPNATPTCKVPANGVRVSIDSGPLLPVSYGDLRTDIAGAFPGFSNGGGAGGAYYIDTTALANGTHQIGWYVVDDCSRAEGIGSRFFTVLNGAADSTATRSTAADLRATDVALRTPGTLGTLAQPIEVRRGVDGALVAPNPSGAHVVPIGQGERVEVVLPAADGAAYAGYQVLNGERRALPLGSSLDAAQGIFYWQPAAGFLGAFDLEFVSAHGGVVHVRAVVGTGVQAVIDTPQAGIVSSSFTIAGWAIEQAATNGTGIDTVHVWAYPATGAAPIFLGVAAYGDTRPDIGALFGDQFAAASYSLTVNSLPPGAYDIVVYPHSAVTGDFHGARVVRVTVRQ